MAQTLLPGSVLAMTDQAADRLLRLDSGDAALLYLHFLRHGDLSHLTWSQQRLDTALDQLKKLRMAPEQPPVSAPCPGSSSPGVFPRGYYRRPERKYIHLSRPVRRGGAAAGQKAVRQRPAVFVHTL